MSVGQSSSLRSQGNFSVSSLSKKLNSETRLFPKVDKDVQTEAFKHNAGITDLLAKLGPQSTNSGDESSPVQEANTITIDVSAVGEQKEIDMSQTISIEIVSRGNDSFDSILKVIDEDGSERVIDDGLQSKTEDELNTMLEKNNKARTPLAVEIDLLKSDIDEMKEKNEEIKNFYTSEEFNNIQEELADLQQQLAKIDLSKESIGRELKLRDEEALSIDDDENPQDSSKTEDAPTDGKREIESLGSGGDSIQFKSTTDEMISDLKNQLDKCGTSKEKQALLKKKIVGLEAFAKRTGLQNPLLDAKNMLNEVNEDIKAAEEQKGKADAIKTKWDSVDIVDDADDDSYVEMSYADAFADRGDFTEQKAELEADLAVLKEADGNYDTLIGKLEKQLTIVNKNIDDSWI